ncbi:MAG: hypothetical protein HQK88_10780 [Nitrospirae bacterium]|nr:hypothetical protein [Nitrospirota bacterium]MBF0535293.1 hypothetical protein [Nitrospirota bacterium]MBF0617284.1 hypothetical protein [Nitrospirota bacterium]
MESGSYRHRVFNIYFHVLECLLKHLGDIDKAVGENKYDCYKIVEDCYDGTMRIFGETKLEDNEYRLINDLLERIQGSLIHRYNEDKELLTTYENIKEYTIGKFDPNIDYLELITNEFNLLGKGISQSCYETHRTIKYKQAQRCAYLELIAASETKVSSISNRAKELYKINLNLGTADFDFLRYINLPFYFFHEYMSHIHSAKFNRHVNSNSISAFEDGWLLFTEEKKYEKYIKNRPYLRAHGCYREKYLRKHFQLANKNINRKHEDAYNLAESFFEKVGIEIFFEITFLIASHDFNSITNFTILQVDFLYWVRVWNESYYKDDLDENIYKELFMDALKSDNPITDFIEVMKMN